jgi:hypothetical protein
MFRPTSTPLTEEQRAAVERALVRPLDQRVGLRSLSMRPDFAMIRESRNLTEFARQTLNANPADVIAHPFPFQAYGRLDEFTLRNGASDATWLPLRDKLDEAHLFMIDTEVLFAVGVDEDPGLQTTQAIIRDNVDLYRQLVTIGCRAHLFNYYAAALSGANAALRYLVMSELPAMGDDLGFDSDHGMGLVAACAFSDNAAGLMLVLDSELSWMPDQNDPAVRDLIIKATADRCAEEVVLRITAALGSRPDYLAATANDDNEESDNDSDADTNSGSDATTAESDDDPEALDDDEEEAPAPRVGDAAGLSYTLRAQRAQGVEKRHVTARRVVDTWVREARAVPGGERIVRRLATRFDLI